MDLTATIRSLPDCVVGGQEIETYLGKVADDLINSIPTQSLAPDFGEGSTIYSSSRAKDAAEQLRNYGNVLNSADNIGKKFCRASQERNQIIYLMGNAFGMVGANASVNAVLSRAATEFETDIIDSVKKVGSGIGSIGKWVVVGLIAIAGILFFRRFYE